MRACNLITIALFVFFIGCDNTTTQIVKPVVETTKPELPYESQIITARKVLIDHAKGEVSIIFLESDIKLAYKGFEGDSNVVRTVYNHAIWIDYDFYLSIYDTNGVRTVEKGDELEVIQTNDGFETGNPLVRVIRNLTRPEVVYEYEDL